MSLKEKIQIALATVFAFYLKTHHFHLNIEGPDFYQYHKLLDKIYKDTFGSFDKLGEEIRALDIYCQATLTSFSHLSLIHDQPTILPAHQMLHELLIDNDKVIHILTEINNLAMEHPGLQNYIQERIDKHEFWGWMLRSTLKGRR